MTEQITIDVSAVVYREDLYPRFEPNPATIQQYSESIDQLPPIELNQRNELIDGYHRWTAHKKAGLKTIQATITHTASDRELLLLAIRRNATHGLQLTNEEKKSKVLELYTGKDDEKDEFSQLFSVSKRTIDRWTSRRDKDMKAERNRRIAEMWLACHTEEEIATALGFSVQPVKDVTKSDNLDTWQKNLILSTYQEPEWTPPLYNVWKAKEKSNGVGHFGNSELSFVDNLLYLYTEPFDIVVDPFAGGGSTIDLCKRRLRRYWVSDRLPIVERRDVRQWDISQGPPPLHKRWGDVGLLYLDPPYWKQAEGKYSKDSQDLANMPLEEFYCSLARFTLDCAAKMKAGSCVALIIQPTQWNAPERQVVDHVLDLANALTGDRLLLEMRISCPYESQQATAQQVIWAKESRKILVLSREIVVFRVR